MASTNQISVHEICCISVFLLNIKPVTRHSVTGSSSQTAAVVLFVHMTKFGHLYLSYMWFKGKEGRVRRECVTGHDKYSLVKTCAGQHLSSSDVFILNPSHCQPVCF